MAAIGGGKFRTRCHIVSKPYAKGKQHPGLISRVTGTLKSVVPSWLQKYFKNGDLAEGREARVQVEENDVALPLNGSEEDAPLPVGPNSPEPSTNNAAVHPPPFPEPSASSALLNFQDVLSRPSLNRSHLRFPTLDASPALGGSTSFFSQPSTSTVPFPGSPFAVAASFSLVKEIKDSSSQHEDDISTTSGFSSRASDKDVPTSKSAPLLWSPVTERNHSGSQQAHASLKKPAFNLSIFSTSSLSVMNSSVLNSSQLGDSPFYPGKTIYGGAAAARTARLRLGTPYQASVRRRIKAKLAGAQPCAVSSATARRILQSLERMSSPLADAKRIPSIISSPLSTSLNHTNLDVHHPQFKKLESSVPPVQKLVIPASAAVPGNCSMRFRPSLTPGAPSRAMEKSHKRTIPDAIPAPPPSISSLSYPLSSPPTLRSAGAKMKRERNVQPSSKRADEATGASDLPAFSLPISSFSLPTFSFSTSASSTASMTSVPAQPALTKESPRVSTADGVPFTFSSPIVKATAASPPSFSPSSGFTFSAPTMKIAPSASNGKLVPAVAVNMAANESKAEFEGFVKPAKVLKSGDVLDIKGPGFASPAQSSSGPDRTARPTTTAPSTPLSGIGDKFKPTAVSWNCDTCLVQKKPSDKMCVACQATQPSTDSLSQSDNKPAKPPAASLASLFSPPAGSWECDTCLVQNMPEVVKCVACDTVKPGTGLKPALTLPPASEASSSLYTTPAPYATTSTSFGLLVFGDKFKKPEGVWSCDVCMVENDAQDVKCVACRRAKPGAEAGIPVALPSAATPVNPMPLLGFGDKFKKLEGSWECDGCCVQNKAEDQLCLACQSAKPGAKAESKGFGSSFVHPSSSTESKPSGFKIGTSSSNSTSDGLKFGGTFSNSTTVSFNFGNASLDSTLGSAGFKFGCSSTDIFGGFKFGGASTELKSTDTSSSAGFKFRNSSDSEDFVAVPTPVSASEEKKNKSLNSGTGFKFGGSCGSSFGSAIASPTTTSASPDFSFELSKPEDKSGSSAFSFLPLKAKSEKGDAHPSTEVVLATTAITTMPTAALANTIPVFGKLPIAESVTVAQSLGEMAAKEPALATSTFMFGKPEEKKDASVLSSGFLFSTAKEADKPIPPLGFSFSKPDFPKKLTKPMFTFGKSAEPTGTLNLDFGQNAADTSAQKPVFGFMANSSSTPVSSSSNSSSSAAPPAKIFLFGQQQESQPASTAAPAPTQPFVFGSTTNSATPTFSFGAAMPASAAPAISSSVFGSGQMSIFGQGSARPSAPAFGSATPPSFSGMALPAPAFGPKPSAATVFGQQPNTTPTFVSSAGGFQFGGETIFGPSGSSNGVFTFGTGSAAAAIPAAPPTFNIGSMKSSFTATSTGQHSIAGRKIKTAVRRRK